MSGQLFNRLNATRGWIATALLAVYLLAGTCLPMGLSLMAARIRGDHQVFVVTIRDSCRIILSHRDRSRMAGVAGNPTGLAAGMPLAAMQSPERPDHVLVFPNGKSPPQKPEARTPGAGELCNTAFYKTTTVTFPRRQTASPTTFRNAFAGMDRLLHARTTVLLI